MKPEFSYTLLDGREVSVTIEDISEADPDVGLMGRGVDSFIVSLDGEDITDSIGTRDFDAIQDKANEIVNEPDDDYDEYDDSIDSFA